LFKYESGLFELHINLLTIKYQMVHHWWTHRLLLKLSQKC